MNECCPECNQSLDTPIAPYTHLESFWRHSPQRSVTAAVLELPGGAGPGHGVRHPGAGDGVHEAGLPRAGGDHGVGAQGSLPVDHRVELLGLLGLLLPLTRLARLVVLDVRLGHVLLQVNDGHVGHLELETSPGCKYCDEDGRV